MSLKSEVYIQNNYCLKIMRKRKDDDIMALEMFG